MIRFVLLAALLGAALGSAGHNVHHLTDADFAEKVGDGKVSWGGPIMGRGGSPSEVVIAGLSRSWGLPECWHA